MTALRTAGEKQATSSGGDMAQEVQIQCVTRTDRLNAHERISHVGGINADGTVWKLSVDDAVAGIKDNRWRFWISDLTNSLWVVVARSSHGTEYLRTEADMIQPANLLRLPECP